MVMLPEKVPPVTRFPVSPSRTDLGLLPWRRLNFGIRETELDVLNAVIVPVGHHERLVERKDAIDVAQIDAG
jgi:hypothetical protein